MTERESRFDWCLGEIDSGRLTLDQCLQRYATADPKLAQALRTAYALRRVTLPETRLAQARVRGQLMAAIARESGPDESPRASVAALPHPARSGARPWAHRTGVTLARAAAIAAAVLLLCATVGWGLTNAAAAALPGDPLYGVKRAQEALALDTALSDTSRGQTLAAIADHRLTEAAAEADRSNNAQASALAGEFSGDLQQVIALSAAMTQKDEDNRAVLAALATELARAAQAQASAASHGHAGLSQALDADLQAAHQGIDDHHLKLPNDHGRGGPGPQPTETPGPRDHPTPGHADKTPTPHGGGNGGTGP
jgi:hypothetical protein